MDNIQFEVTPEETSVTFNATSGGDISDVKVNGVSVVENTVANIDLTGKVDKAEGKGLSTNDYTNADKTKLEGIEEGATKVEKTSDITNDSGFIDKDVNNLTNYSKTTEVVLKTDIVDNLTSTDTDKPLSANMGNVLKELLDNTVTWGITFTDGTTQTDEYVKKG